MYNYDYRRMAYQHAISCSLGYKFLMCSLPIETLGIDLTLMSMKVIHDYRRFQVPNNSVLILGSKRLDPTQTLRRKWQNI